ncbi:Sec23-binding domain of Sec16-domain-containing protein [Xylaria bambusicola]|uniref:Sec23-binding domain of Sec16-domain-containing protein n=1 Tax=Xylaria bambusicola TaxID=326684 RepID=UPI0020085594|nr:Sec23-binding domain of Sec16-domain-containing protein [Xylaria bambusicola]KAI0514360.1 Sec23-binding domain of Sec16-domain-containing protein [Xylaria bambusicola]
MDADTPSAAWHPAKRPNSSADEQPFTFNMGPKPGASDSPDKTSQPSDATNLALKEESPETATATAAASTEHPSPAEYAAAQSPNHAGKLDHLEHDEESGAALWDMEAPATNDDVTSMTPHNEESVAASPERAPTEQASKHLSTMSFARTVSHEMSFNDDEDAEWNLQRSETDLFGFMPETDRTNSFPVVPQRQDSITEQYSHPLPSTQAEEILQELEGESAHDDATASEPRAVGQPGDARASEHGEEKLFQNTVGGDFVGIEEDASDARYEEGLPLIPQQHSPEANGDIKQTGADPSDLFSQDETGEAGDDFFTQMGESSQLAAEPLLDHTLQRKSTTMVIGNNVDMEPLSPTEELNSRLQDIPSSSVNGDSIHSPEGGAKITNGTEDIDAKWAAAFGDDDDDGFLLDATTESKELDPADIFGSDDEGFLDDEAEPTPLAPSQTQTPQPYTNGSRYAPESVQQQPYAASNPYAPAPLAGQFPAAQQQPPYAPSNTAPPTMGFGVPPPKPSIPKAQSFVNKSKGGYQSPYDLPMEVVKPKKRASAQQLPRVNVGLSAPPSILPAKSATGYAQPPPSGGSVSSSSPPSSSHSNLPPSHVAPKGTPQLKSKASFFEDLPMTSRPRPSSRQSTQPSPTQPSVFTPPQGPPMSTPPMNPTVAPLPAQSSLSPPTQVAGVAGLVAPERVSPYASLQSDSPTRPLPPSTTSSRYSPALAQPPGINGTGVAPASASRYSPAPPNSRSSSGSYSAVPPPMLAHQPRTSSPLAHFEVSHGKSDNKLGSPINGDGVPLMRTSSSQYEHRVTRVPSLPPTQEVEEEQSLDVPEMSTKALGIIPPEPRYPPIKARHTPPPMGIPPSNPLSPPKRSLSNYAPHPAPNMPSKETNFVPPPRSQTQSPGSVHGNRGLTKSMDPAPRPSSAHSPTSPRSFPGVQSMVPTVRTRGMSQSLNLVPPTDGREHDSLQRWRGAPSIAWGIGGLFVSTFPKDVPRYGISSNVPQIIRSPGEVKVRHMKDIQPLEERLSKFPGPLKGKSKKKEVVGWLTTGIDGLERTLPNVSFQQHVSHEDKRAAERVLLWKILRILVENDGVLEGNPTVEKAVRDIISPGVESVTPELSSEFSSGAGLAGMASTGAVQADAADPTATESIRRCLLIGDREKAVWMAVDKRLWGHAILISGSMSNPELYKQVAREFIKKEVNHTGRGNESLASLYSVLSGNFEDAVDELVPAHARAGFQLMSPTASTSSTSQDVLAGLDKWCETLGLILSNRRQGDGEALRSLGNLLSGYGRAEAAHICYIFSRHFSIFGGLDDPNVNFVLVGADHRRQADQFAKETEALQLSEVYEYGLSLAPGSHVVQSCPHLAAYKLQHAMVLAEHGFRDKALQYCEAIWSAITSQTKKSPYFNPILESAVDDLMKRLKQAAGEESSSWITKPKMDQVSSNMWSRFSKFVAGPDDGTENGAPGEGGAEVGPFARIAGGTPTVSRSPSVSNFEVYGSSPSMPMNKASSAYAPAAAYPTTSPYEPIGGAYTPTARSSMERTSGELTRSSYDLGRRGSDIQNVAANPYAPVSISSSLPKNSYQPVSQITPDVSPYMPTSEIQPSPSIPEQSSNVGYPGYQPFGGDQGSEGVGAIGGSDNGFNSGYQPSYGSYEPPSTNSFESPALGENTSGGYEPPSYQPSGFEPPSYEPGPVDDNESETKPKPRSFMDDDDDDIPGLRSKEKSKAEKDRENEEMFKKVAEEEAKRAAEAKAAKKGGWGLGSWFGGGKKEPMEIPNKPIKAKLGEASSFVYDPELKRWVNKKPGAENAPAKTATPPPPRASSTPPTSTTSAPPVGMMTPPPPRPIPTPMRLNKAISQESLNAPGGAPLMARSVSGQSNASLPPRPATSLSNASSIEDLLGAAGPRKGPKKTRKSGRYVDVMAK